MQKPGNSLLKTINESSELIQKLSKQLTFSSILRLFLVCIGLAIIFGTSYSIEMKVYANLVLVIMFFLLLKRHIKLKGKKNFEIAKKQIAESELKALDRNFEDFGNGLEYVQPNHDYAVDIDLFGKNSLFQHINRTQLIDGEKYLAQLLLENNIDKVKERQDAYRELAQDYSWRRDYQAQASLVKKSQNHHIISAWMKDYSPILPKGIIYLTYVITILSLLSLVGNFYDLVPTKVPLILFFIGLAITGIFFKRITKLIAHTSKAHDLFAAYEKLIQKIENKEFQSSLLQETCAPIQQFEGKNASAVINKYAKLLALLDQRNNALVALFSNAFFLTEIRVASKLENWIESYGEEIETWFEVLTKMDALHSLANYVFIHPENHFPELTNSTTILDVQNAIHPTMDPEKSIGNNILLKEKHFLIITGANMAGKSTFLRTVCMQILMGNLGLSVTGNKGKYNPVKLITSMRTVDSLDDETSYFFAELKRLKYIKDKTKNGRYFILLDEILKGTNSIDKAEGSKRFLNELVKDNLTGIIATHDLSLCTLSNELEVVHNYYLDAEIIENELHFDYTLKEGICKNMNASFLLEKMGLVPKS